MSDINSYLLQKMGWKHYHSFHGIPFLGKGNHNSFWFENKELIRYHLYDLGRKVCFIIKELTSEEKQISNKLYNFIVIELLESKADSSKTFHFSTNQELIKLVIEHEACNEQYQRHFRINKILKQ
jgi:hypothetical protein